MCDRVAKTVPVVASAPSQSVAMTLPFLSLTLWMLGTRHPCNKSLILATPRVRGPTAQFKAAKPP
jgi:hypothetical protein